MKTMRRKTAIAVMVAFALTVAACGGGDAGDTTTTEETIPPLASTTTTTTAAPAEQTTTTVAEYDLVAAVNDYTSTIPDGFMAVSDITAFKDAVAASDALVIDVRETGEYAEGHILDAVNIPLRTVAENLGLIPMDRSVFVYCKSGLRAALAVSSLHMLGYDNVLAFPPGWSGWTAAGEEVSTGTVEAEVVGAPDVAPEMLAAVNDFLTTIPDGFLSAGDVQAVKDAVDAGAALIDVRTEAEYAEGFIPGAINVDLRTIPANLDMIPTDQPIVSYCKSGYRAGLSVPIMHVLGFDTTKAFTGSYNAWTDANEPVETP